MSHKFHTHSQRKSFRELFGGRQDFSSLEGSQSGERASEETGALETQTTVHRVGGELESLLLDVPLLELSR